MFGVAGLQRRLLCQVQRFDRGWWPAMIILELDREFAAAGVDVGAAGGPGRAEQAPPTGFTSVAKLISVSPRR